MRQFNLHLTQNLILKIDSHPYSLFRKKYHPNNKNMELQFSQTSLIDLQERKYSQNTCNSSNSNSPNSDIKIHQESGSKSLRQFSTGLYSPRSQQTPQKMFLAVSVQNLSSLQKKTFLVNEEMYKDLSVKMINSESGLKRFDMEVETQQQNIDKAYKDNSMNNGECIQNVKKVANIKNEQLARQTKNIIYFDKNQSNQKTANQIINSNNVNSQVNQQRNNQNTNITTLKDNRPLPSYNNARSALYVWIRNLCLQMKMCIDVFALTMKYLDQYHNTYGNPYNRYTFTINAYGMIILASKIMNKQILTPKIIAQKINAKKQQLQEIQMNLIKMMNFEVYFETFIKLLQRRLQKWQQACEYRNLKFELSFFEQNITSFKRLYCLTKEVQVMAKVNYQITNDMILSAFIRSLSGQFKKNYKASILFGQILCDCFGDLIEENGYEYNFDKILQRINNEMDEQDESKIWDIVSINFERRNKRQVYQNYNVFLNSIFEMEI